MAKLKKIAINGSEVPAVPGSRKIGTTPPDERIEVAVHLRRCPSSKGLPSMEELAAQPPHKRKHLTHEEFESIHGASPDDVAKVKSFAHEHNLDVEEVNLAQRMVTITGTIKAFSSAFGVQFFNHELPEYSFRSHDGPIEIPEELADIVDGVFGLDDIPVAKPFVSNSKKKASAATPGNSSEETFYPNQVAQLYRFPKDVTGAGQSIAIIELGGGYELKYLQDYFNKINLPVPKITDVLVAGGENKPYKGKDDYAKYFATIETYADIEVVGAVANKAEIVVYFAKCDLSGFLQALKKAVHDTDHNNSVISISWGQSEKSLKERLPFTKAFDQTLQEAAAKGITVCVASGDAGSSDDLQTTDGPAYVDFPASSPFSLGCGGTRLFVEGNEIKNEIVWKQTLDEIEIDYYKFPGPVTTSTGGGVSEIFECPGYQGKASVCPKSVNSGGKTGRGVPDIAGNADERSGYIIQYSNKVTSMSGTSLVAPLYAGLIALINQKLNARVGFLNPFLYGIGESKDVFNDITEGDNITTEAGGYYAQKGWDACTGWGSINGQNLLKTLQDI